MVLPLLLRMLLLSLLFDVAADDGVACDDCVANLFVVGDDAPILVIRKEGIFLQSGYC